MPLSARPMRVSGASGTDVTATRKRAIKADVPARRQVDYVALQFDAPPSINEFYRNVAGVGRALTASAKAWLITAGWQIEITRPGRIVGSYSISITVRRASLRRDLGNYEKQISDLLVSLRIIDDDRHCERIELAWSAEGSGVAVEVMAS